MLQFTKKYPSKRAFITGAGSGLGKEMSLLLAQDGWTIGITDINESDLRGVATEIEKVGGKALTYLFDVGDEVKYEEVVEDFLSKTQGIDLLINNAGVGDNGKLNEYSLENWKWMVSVNQMGVLYGCHFFAPTMRKQKSGYIINIASAAAFISSPRMGAYNMTKAAVRSLSETLDAELKGYNIGISVVMPTFIKTNVMQHARGSEAAKKGGAKMLARTKLTALAASTQILKRAGKGEFNIVLPGKAQIFYAFKRFMPNTFRKLIANRFTKLEKELGI